ncbi:MAG: serpin family protein [Alkalinema sp. RU_4_3]|nr:serpin family protein [Alkalinema sp. RU_4_3]
MQPSIKFLTSAVLATTLGLFSLSCIDRAQSASPKTQTRASLMGRESRAIAQTPPAAKKVVSSAALDANRRFGFALLQAQLANHPKTENLFISPTSISQALAMVYLGSAGKTRQGMEQTLQSGDMSPEALTQGNVAIKNLLENPGDEKVQLTVANSLWVNEGASLKDSFVEQNRSQYRARVSILNFADPRTLDRINNWAKRSTKGKIPQILDQIDPQGEVIVANAVYFKGDWSRPFEKKLTTDRPFQLDEKRRKPLPFMNQGGKYSYLETPQFQAIRLSYGDTKRFGMYVFLPKGDLTTWTKGLTDETWNQWMGQFASKQGTIALPKFKINYTSKLNDSLKALGMADAFTKQADFSAMSTNNVLISNVTHKTILEVDETGTEAAAVTTIEVVATSAQILPDKPFNMVVDRPFFVAIVDQQTGLPFFMGQISDPGR